MNKLINAINSFVVSFAKGEAGAQVVEYALIIAVVSIVLVVALADSTSGISSKFAALVTRIGNCFSSTNGSC